MVKLSGDASGSGATDDDEGIDSLPDGPEPLSNKMPKQQTKRLGHRKETGRIGQEQNLLDQPALMDGRRSPPVSFEPDDKSTQAPVKKFGRKMDSFKGFGETSIDDQMSTKITSYDAKEGDLDSLRADSSDDDVYAFFSFVKSLGVAIEH